MLPILDKFGEFHSLETAIHTYEVFNVELIKYYLSMSPLTWCKNWERLLHLLRRKISSCTK